MRFTGLKYYLVIWRNRILALILLAVLSLVFVLIRKWYQDQPQSIDTSRSAEYYQYQKYIDSVKLAERKLKQTHLSRDVQPKKEMQWNPQPIDPNKALKEDWLNLGLNAGQSNTILKYLKKGGTFQVKSDLQKIYTIDDEDYKRIEPYLMLPDTLRNFLVQSEDSFDSAVDIKELEDDKLNISIALNESEAEDYQKIQGLGEVLSHRIIKYRNLLGGFYRKEQLLEVYGIDSTLFEEIEPYISIDYKNLEHLNVNELGANNLSKHPYITYNMALIVTRDRKKNGPFKNKKELMNRGLLNEHLYSKIAPYITVK
ncbi:MAG TPA: hypothetical protein DDX92_09550 [Flavobacteriales bacterium]|jgi:competence protein ComEA|nr:hypothetical protein [Flavobacteriales bacterium]